MSTFEEKVDAFLAQKRLAVSGVSRTGESAANGIYRKLKTQGYTVFPLNPNADEFDGDRCYPSIEAIPDGVDGVVIVNRPEVTEQVVRACAAAGVPRVWMHQSLGFFPTSVSEEAIAFCRQNGIEVIAGGCPMMFCEPDFGHKCMRWWMKRSGRLPA